MNIEPERTCEACGKFGAVLFAEEALCVDCYSERGSSCAGAGKEEEAKVVSIE
jgi:hypothetical protein